MMKKKNYIGFFLRLAFFVLKNFFKMRGNWAFIVQNLAKTRSKLSKPIKSKNIFALYQPFSLIFPCVKQFPHI